MALEAGSRTACASGDRNTFSSPPAPSATAAERDVAEALHEAIDAAHRAGDRGATFRSLGKRAGVPHQHVHDWTLALSGRTPRTSQVLELGANVALAFCEILAAKLRARLNGRASHDLRDLALGAQRSTGALAGAVREALRDGVVTPDEAASIRAIALDMQADASAILAACERSRAQGGVP